MKEELIAIHADLLRVQEFLAEDDLDNAFSVLEVVLGYIERRIQD